MFLRMKRNKVILKSVNVDGLERTLDKCLIWFYSFPLAKIGLNDLSKSIGSSKTGVKQIVEHLVKIGFLNRDVIGKAWLLSANQKHSYFITKKIPYNLGAIYESGLLDAVYNKVDSARTIVLFGSYRYGSDVEDSDIDIAVEILGDDELSIIPLETNRASPSIRKLS